MSVSSMIGNVEIGGDSAAALFRAVSAHFYKLVSGHIHRPKNWQRFASLLVLALVIIPVFLFTEAASAQVHVEAISNGHGSVSGGGYYNEGDTVTLTAIVEEIGYHFDGWNDLTKPPTSYISTDNPYVFNATNISLVGVFSLNYYAVAASATAGGTASGGGDYLHGWDVELKATADSGYHFVNWTKDGTVVSTDADYSFKATGTKNGENITLVANFSADPGSGDDESSSPKAAKPEILQPEPPAFYPLPEDEVGAYALLADGTKEYLLFHTYDICMAWLDSDALCSGPGRCYHKDGK